MADGLKERRPLLAQRQTLDAQLQLSQARSQRQARQQQVGTGDPGASLQAGLDGLRASETLRQTEQARCLNRLRLYRALYGLDHPFAA